MPTTEKKYFYGLDISSPRYTGGPKAADGFNEASDMSNVKISPNGGPVCRKGRYTVGTVTENIHTIGWFKSHVGLDYLILGAGDKIYLDPAAGGTSSLSRTLVVGDIKGDMSSYNMHLFYVDGTNENAKWDGLNLAWKKLGVSAPAAAPTTALVAAGVLTGTYQHAYTYVYKDAGLGYEAESRFSAYSAELTAATQNINVGYVASTDAQVTHIRIYRIGGAIAEWRLVAEIANGTGTYTDNNSDDTVIQLPEYPLEGEPLDINDTPVNFNGIVQWRNRLWGWKGSYLYSTREGRPEKWFNEQSDYQAINMDPESGQEIIGAIPFSNILVVWTRTRMYFVTGEIEPWAVVEARWNLGLVAKRSPAVCAGYLFWLSNDGVYMWDGVGEPKPASGPINRDFEGNSRGLMECSNAFLAGAVGVYVEADDGTNYAESAYKLSVPYANTSVNNQRTFSFDMNMYRLFGMRFSPWTLDDIAFSDAVINYKREFYSAKASAAVNNAYMRELSGSQDDGVDVVSYYETRHWNFGSSSFDKAFDFITISGYATESITVKTIFDFGDYIDTLVLSMYGDMYDVDKWDEAYFAGGGLMRRHDSYPQAAIGNKIGFRIEMSGDAKFDMIETIWQPTAGRMGA